MLAFGYRKEFDDPRLAHRRLFGELLGTFMLVLVAAGGGLLHGKGQISLSAAVVAPGLMVMAIILSMGAVSGAHLNPVVSLAFALRGDFPWKRVPGYIVVQLLGAALAACSCSPCSETSGTSGDAPGRGYRRAGLRDGMPDRDAGQRHPRNGVVGPEHRDDRRPGGRRLHRAGRAVGSPVSGASMNPARSLGPALIAGDWTAFLGLRRRAAGWGRGWRSAPR